MTEEREVNMLEERLQEKILNTIDELAYIQAYINRQFNLDRLEEANDDWFNKRGILRLLLSIQIPDKAERNTVVDYICEGIQEREWRKYVNDVETRD